ncbi:unnamed protein product [Urochloa decumbens]|uniref:AIPP2-like SPOC-like domain-containing protein n=1 Tax=Urochloa decumbens TaxID=240449 RepID=A0ABC8XCC4_9POAL
MDAVVCETCGSGSKRHLILKCARCNASKHRYCMKVVPYEIPREWYCAGCQEYADGCPNPSQGGQTELQKPSHGCDKMKGQETGNMHLSHSNVAHQINPRSSNKFGSAKVKFISSEEVALLNREWTPYVRSRSAHLLSPPNTKHSFNLKHISPSRSDTQVQAMKRYGAVSHDQTKIEASSYFAKHQKQVHPASPSSMKQLSNMKSISPSKGDMQVQGLKRCAAPRRYQEKIEGRADFVQSQVRPASPPHVKQLSNTKCISPNRTEMQVHAMKRCDAASPNQEKIVDVNMKQDTRSGGSMPIIRRYRKTSETVEVKLDSLFEDKAREVKIGNEDKGEINSEIEDAPRENRALCASDGDTGSKSEMENLNQHRDVLISIDPSMEYTRRPPPGSCWEGRIHVSDAGANLNLGCFKAQFPSKVSRKVYDIVENIPDTLKLELLPRMNDWPKSFEISGPVYEDIGLFFFPDEPDGHEKHSYLLEASNNYVLRAHIKGTSTKLLIYSSEVLPHDSQWIDGESYLWGVFVRLKGKSDSWQFGSSTT